MSRILVFVLLTVLGATRSHAQENTTREQQLSFLDAESGLLIALQLPQLQAAHALAAEVLPEERQVLNLAALGAGAILGFSPFSAKAWSTSGFDTQTPLMAQLAAGVPGEATLRSRIVLRANNLSRARTSIQRMRIRDKARPRVVREALSPLMAGIRNTPSESQVRKRLRDAGVFLVGRPLPLSGLLFVQTRGDFILIDLVDPSGRDFDGLIATLGRAPGALSATSPGADVLLDAPIGLWARATPLGASLERLAGADTKRKAGCRAIADLGRASSVQSLSLRGEVARDALTLQATWHLQASNDVLKAFTTTGAPLLRGGGLLDATIRFTGWSRLRDHARPAEAQSWDAVWARSSQCGHGSQVYAAAMAWPGLLGLFLSELSMLHPQAKTAIEALGATSAQISVGKHSRLTYFTEAWVAEKGATVAKGWIKSLFGSERIAAGKHRWGDGAIRPYALDLAGGSVIGAGYRPGSRHFALSSAKRPATVPAAQDSDVLASLSAQPAALATQLGTLPQPALWKHWRALTAVLQRGEKKLELTVSLQRSGDR